MPESDVTQNLVLKEARQKQIYEIIQHKRVVTVEFLVRTTYSSPATIRRDLDILERGGLVKRIHGGATLVNKSSNEPAQQLREHVNAEKKAVIADLAIDLISSSSSVFLDSSTTNRYILPLLKKFSSMTYVTNSFKTASELAKYVSDDIFLIGGKVIESSNSTGGCFTYEFLERWYCDLAFISTPGVSARKGATVVNPDQAMIKKTMMKNSRKSVLLCDSTKFEAEYLCQVGSFADFHYFVTDSKPTAGLYDEIARHNCELIYP